MKRTYLWLIACLTVLAVILSGCASGQNDSDVQSSESGMETVSSSDSQNDEDTALQIRVETDSERIIFALNDSSAARSLYNQLPLILPVEDYSTNEKIFYPPEELDVSDAPSAEGPAGTLAYYEPWGDVAMFYSPCGNASGLYKLGEAVSGTKQIENLSGEIRIEKVEDSAEEPPQDNSPAQSTEDSSETNNSSARGSSSARPSSSALLSSSAQEGSKQTNTPSTPTESIPPESEMPSAPATTEETEENMRNIEITVNGKTFSATLNDNEAARAFAEMLPLTLDMSDYSGFEKVGSLGTSLPTSNQQTTTQSGDIVLYNGNQIVIFYGSNSWSYTRLGKVDDLSGWKDALGMGSVTVNIRIKN